MKRPFRVYMVWRGTNSGNSGNCGSYSNEALAVERALRVVGADTNIAPDGAVILGPDGYQRRYFGRWRKRKLDPRELSIDDVEALAEAGFPHVVQADR